MGTIRVNFDADERIFTSVKNIANVQGITIKGIFTSAILNHAHKHYVDAQIALNMIKKPGTKASPGESLTQLERDLKRKLEIYGDLEKMYQETEG